MIKIVEIERAISNVLKEHFKNDKIYIERKEALDFKKASFLIHKISDKFTKKLGNLYQNQIMYQIIYIEKEDGSFKTDYEKFSKIASTLYEKLEHIEVKNIKLRSYDMNYRIEDNTMQFFVTFKIRYYREKEKIYMKELKLNENIKEE